MYHTDKQRTLHPIRPQFSLAAVFCVPIKKKDEKEDASVVV